MKVAGHRIELGEIEATLLEHPMVSEAVVAAVGKPFENKHLIAYVVPTAASPVADSANQTDETQESVNWPTMGLYEHLRSKLPEYMIPSRIVPIETLPLTSNGKVDRNALPKTLIQPHEHASKSIAARTPTEQALVHLWSELLELSNVAIEENFLKIGGDSLLAIKLLARVRADFNVEVPFRVLFKNPTIAALAETIEQLVAAQPMDQRFSEGVLAGKESCIVPMVPALSSDEEEGVL